MPDLREIFSKVTEALAAADEGQKILTNKIASQAEEIKHLRETNACADNYRCLVDKLASAGVVDEYHAVYLKDNVTDGNVNDFLTKLANVVEPKQASAPSPYEVSNIPMATESGTNKDLEDCNRKLRSLYGK